MPDVACARFLALVLSSSVTLRKSFNHSVPQLSRPQDGDNNDNIFITRFLESSHVQSTKNGA